MTGHSLLRSPLTPDLVERRFAELQQLVRLGASLAEAVLPPIERRVLARRSVLVVGRLADPGADPRDVRLRVAKNAIDRHLGWMADTWIDPVGGQIVGAGVVALVAAFVDEHPVDALPRGHHGTLTVRFLVGRPACVDALPLVDRSDEHPRLWLCSAYDHARTSW